MLPGYSKELEQQIQELNRRLSEKNKQQYAAIEAVKLSYGDISYIAKLFGYSRDTIRTGIKGLDQEYFFKFLVNRTIYCSLLKVSFIVASIMSKGSF